jgi:hypothetical protein
VPGSRALKTIALDARARCTRVVQSMLNAVSLKQQANPETESESESDCHECKHECLPASMSASKTWWPNLVSHECPSMSAKHECQPNLVSRTRLVEL